MTANKGSGRQKGRTSPFLMPSIQKMTSRKSSITNAFVNSIIPSIPPTEDEVLHALKLLAIDPENMTCAYCGNKYTEWDHLRPLVVNQRPTGYVSEIANLVPACGKCNQSKGNKPWRDWMLSETQHSPAGRSIPDVAERMARLEEYERWRPPTKIDFQTILGEDDWNGYWVLWKTAMEDLERYQVTAELLRARIAKHLATP